MKEVQIRKLAAVVPFLAGLYGGGSFIATGNLLFVIWAVGFGLVDFLIWFDISEPWLL